MYFLHFVKFYLRNMVSYGIECIVCSQNTVTRINESINIYYVRRQPCKKDKNSKM